MNLVIKLIESPWFWLDIFLSCFGGILVWRGLKIENEAGKLLPPENFKPDIFRDIVEKYKCEIERGSRILMRGIVIEVIAALGISLISGYEIAALNEKAEVAENAAAQASERASTNAWQVAELTNETVRLSIKLEGSLSNNLVLAKDVFGLIAQTEQMSNTIAQVREIVHSPEIAVKLNEAKSSLTAANKIINEVKSLLTNSDFKELSSIKPKSLQRRIIELVDSYNKSAIKQLNDGSNKPIYIDGTMDQSDWIILDQLANEPNAFKYLQIEHQPTSVGLGEAGRIIVSGFKFWLYPALLQKK